MCVGEIVFALQRLWCEQSAFYNQAAKGKLATPFAATELIAR
jgi:hypothetical protein